MDRRALRLIALLAFAWPVSGCPSRQVPPHLRLDTSGPEEPTQLRFGDPSSAVATIIGEDPLARSPTLPPDQDRLEFEGPLQAYVDAIRQVERRGADPAQTLQQVEDRHRGTAAVPLSRGYRLRLIENRLPAADLTADSVQADILTMLSALRDEGSSPPAEPLRWLVRGRDPRDAVLAHGDRWVLQAWLDGPGVPLAHVQQVLGGVAHDHLRETDLGRLILARASGATASVDRGFDALSRATLLSLTRVAADLDREQAAWAELRRAEAESMGVEDPELALLDRAVEELTAAAADDRAAGGAVLALHARRWLRSTGAIDRVDAISASARWHDDVASLAGVWRVIALKEAVDGMDAGVDTVRFPDALVDLVDALAGTGAGPFPTWLVARRTPDAALWTELGRTVGTSSTTDWEQVRAAVGAHLDREGAQALDRTRDPDIRSLIERIQRRAR